MIIDIIVHVEGCKDVKCVSEVNPSWNYCVTSKDWDKVC